MDARATSARTVCLRHSSFSEDDCEELTPCCPICGSEDVCTNPDACSLAFMRLEASLNDAPPSNLEFDEPVSFDPVNLPF